MKRLDQQPEEIEEGEHILILDMAESQRMQNKSIVDLFHVPAGYSVLLMDWAVNPNTMQLNFKIYVAKECNRT